MTLTNDTLLRGYLAHMKSEVRSLFVLYGERTARSAEDPDGYANWLITHQESVKQLQEQWDILRRDVGKVLEVRLVPFSQLADAQFVTGDTDPGASGRDPLRITFAALKRKADKARRKDPTITLLKSWDIEARKPQDK